MAGINGNSVQERLEGTDQETPALEMNAVPEPERQEEVASNHDRQEAATRSRDPAAGPGQQSAERENNEHASGGAPS